MSDIFELDKESKRPKITPNQTQILDEPINESAKLTTENVSGIPSIDSKLHLSLSMNEINNNVSNIFGCTDQTDSRTVNSDHTDVKSTSMICYEEWKQTKWGEGDIDNVELDPEDLEFITLNLNEFSDEFTMLTWSDVLDTINQIYMDYVLLTKWITYWYNRPDLMKYGFSLSHYSKQSSFLNLELDELDDLVSGKDEDLTSSDIEDKRLLYNTQRLLFQLLAFFMIIVNILYRVTCLKFVIDHFDRTILLNINYATGTRGTNRISKHKNPNQNS